MSCLLVETVCAATMFTKYCGSRVLEKLSSLCAKLILNRHQLVKYFGFPLPELEIIYPICAKGCRKIRDAEFLEDIRYTLFIRYSIHSNNLFLSILVYSAISNVTRDQCAFPCLSTTRYLAPLTLNASRTRTLILFFSASCGILVYRVAKS